MVYALFVNHRMCPLFRIRCVQMRCVSLFVPVGSSTEWCVSRILSACLLNDSMSCNKWGSVLEGMKNNERIKQQASKGSSDGVETVHGCRVLLVPTLQLGRWQMVLNWPHVIEHCLLDNLKQGLQIVPLLTNGWLTSLVAWEAIYCPNLPHFHMMLENCCHMTPLNGLLLHLLKTASGTEAQNSSAPTRMPSYKPEHGSQTSYVFCTLILPSSKSKNI